MTGNQRLVVIKMKNYRQDLYDVYVSYPPDTDKERINACLYEDMDEEKAQALIDALASRTQALVEEKCNWERREEVYYYFNYLGLDVVTRRYMELEAVEEKEAEEGDGDFLVEEAIDEPEMKTEAKPLPNNTKLWFLALLIAFFGYLLGKIF